LNKETNDLLSKYGLSEDHKEAIYEVWKFISRCTVVMQERYLNEPLHQKIDDYKLITSKTVTKNGNRYKAITSQKELPFRTRMLFIHHYTDTGRAYMFFNLHNETNSIKWLFENHLSQIKLKVSEWVDTGLIAHIKAIRHNYITEDDRKKI